MDLDTDTSKGNLCCVGKELHFTPRNSGCLVPYPAAYDVIKGFMNVVNAGKVIHAIGEPSDAQLKEIKIIYQVNVIDKSKVELSTTLFAPLADFNQIPSEKVEYVCFAKPKEPIHILHDGPISYLGYWCRVHKTGYRVARYEVKWLDNKKWATCGNEDIDHYIGLPKQPLSPFGPMKPV